MSSRGDSGRRFAHGMLKSESELINLSLVKAVQ